MFAAGWKWEREFDADRGLLCRPGKKGGVSATVGMVTSQKNGWPLFFSFTSNGSPFDQGRGYDRFGVFARLRHNGDFRAAAKALVAMGYGTPDKTGKPVVIRSTSGAREDGTRPINPADASIGDCVNLADLMAADLPEPKFLVEGLLPLGLSILAARPKAGKSWLALLWAIALSEGGSVGDGLTARKVPVLYLALEDTRRRFRDRAAKVLAATGMRASPALDIRVQSPRAGAGGLALIAEWFSAHRGGLVVVDTLAKFRDPAGRDGAYASDYKAVADLKALADQYGGGVLLIHHTRKGGAEDPFDEVSGTLGINGAADSMFVVDRTRGDTGAALYVTGRDIQEQTFPMTWSAERCLWQIGAPTEGITRPEPGQAPNRAGDCADWLRAFIGGYSWPDAELMAAAKKAGFGERNVKDAKRQLRQEQPALCSRTFERGGAWWNWIGEMSRPAPTRPGCVDVQTSQTCAETT